MITAISEMTSIGSRNAHDSVEDAAASGISRTAIAAQLEKILASSTFVRSKRLGRFLRFAVEQCLDGHQNALKEYLVGVEVFNKLETFDPRIDSIVRVEARRLRSKLERYYQTEGRDDSVVIQFRKGSYVPLLMTREQLKSMGFGEDVGFRGSVKTVAVGKLNGIGLDDNSTHFCMGLAEDLISALTKIPTLRVVARLGGNSEEVRGDYVLEGSVRRQGDRFRIAMQLIDTANNLYVWSETYERDLSDAFAVQDDISRAIVLALRKEFHAVRP